MSEFKVLASKNWRVQILIICNEGECSFAGVPEKETEPLREVEKKNAAKISQLEGESKEKEADLLPVSSTTSIFG